MNISVTGLSICHINLARGFRGGERQTELLIRALSGEGVRQKLIARKNEPLARKMRLTPNLEIVEVNRPFISSVSHCRDMDVLQVHEAKAGHLACQAHSLYGIPYVVTRRVDKPPRATWINRRLYGKAGAVVTVSEAIAGVLDDVFGPLGVEVIPDAYSDLPVNDSRVDEIKRRFEGKFLIGHAGALVDRHKGQLTLIKAFDALSDVFPDLALILLGEGEDEALLKEAAGRNRDIHFEGFVSNLGDYLAAMDLFVFPSRFEGLGSVVLDAMHAGLPIVASRVGGLPEIVREGGNGLLVEPDKVSELSAAIRKLYSDKALYKQYASASVPLADAYSPASMAKQYMDIYMRLRAENAA